MKYPDSFAWLSLFAGLESNNMTQTNTSGCQAPLVYSELIIKRLKYLEKVARGILQLEMNITVRRTRFFYQGYLYPLQIVAFEDKTKLGFFDADSFSIGINKEILFSADETRLKNLIRHELAHYICFIKFGATIKAHGEEFKNLCRSFGWGNEIYSAKEQPASFATKQLSKISEKIQKLLSLANSDNIHEAQAAAARAQKLMLEYNIQTLETDIENELVVKKLTSTKRKNAKLSAIFDILKHFLVVPVFNYGKGVVYLEVTGKRANVEIAEYVFHYLDQELEKLWKDSKKENSLKGVKAKNSFYFGVAEGFEEQMYRVKSELNSEQSKALIIIQQDLQKNIRAVYRGLSASSSSAQMDQTGRSLGQRVGSSLTIKRGLKSSNQTYLLE